jgi:hypothetical protein
METKYPPGLEWLSDWRDPGRYPPVNGTSGTQWAGEFLRRNPTYQEAHKYETTFGSLNIVPRVKKVVSLK